MPFVLFSLPFWRLELDELLACVSIPMSFLGRNYLSRYLVLCSACLAPGLPFPTVEFAPHACAEGSSAWAAKAAHVTPASWPLASSHPKARRKHWTSWLIASVIPIFEITYAVNQNFSFKDLFYILWLCETCSHKWYLKITVNGLFNFIWTIHLDEKNKNILPLKRKGNRLADT